MPSSGGQKGGVTCKIRLTVLCAKYLARKDFFRLPDPFARVIVDGSSQYHCTDCCAATLSPKWNQHFDLYVGGDDVVTITVWNDRKARKRQGSGFLGCVRLRSNALHQLKDTGYQQLELGRCESYHTEVVRGKLIVSLLSLDRHSAVPSAISSSSCSSSRHHHHQLQQQRNVTVTAGGALVANRAALEGADAGDTATVRTNGSTQGDGGCYDNGDDDDLPEGWERRCAPNGRTYYVNHVTRSTQWRRPDDTEPPTDSAAAGRARAACDASETAGLTLLDQRQHQLYLSRNQLHQPLDLPHGYEIRTTARGQVYYWHEPSGRATWHDPRLSRDSTADAAAAASSGSSSTTVVEGDEGGLGALPSGWERRLTSTGRVYFVDHVRRVTQFADPRLTGRLHSTTTIPTTTTTSTAEACSEPVSASPAADGHVSSESAAAANECGRKPVERPTAAAASSSSCVDRPSCCGADSANDATTDSMATNATTDALATTHQQELSPSSVSPATSSSRNDSHTVSDQVTTESSQDGSSAEIAAGVAPTEANDRLTGEITDPTTDDGSGQSERAPELPPRAASPTSSSVQPPPLPPRSPVPPPLPARNLPAVSGCHASTSTAVGTAAGLSCEHEPLPRYRRDLVAKLKVLRAELHALQPTSGHCRLEVSRDEVFEESYRLVMKKTSKEMRKRLMVKFRGEEGLDYGGVAREWLYLLSHEMLNPYYGLFQYSRDDIYTLQINPNSAINPEHLSYFYFVGRIIGVAVFHGHYIDGGFAMPFYKMLLNKPIALPDIQFVDPDLYRSLTWMLENDVEGVFETTFSVEHDNFGQISVRDLKPGGRDIRVTDSNKKEYVRLYVQLRFMEGIEQQFLSLQKGFNELIPQDLLKTFDEREMELLIGGLGKIDVDDWRQHTRLKHCSADDSVVRWFWTAVESYSEEMRARLLQFITGSSRVPLQGFKALQGSTGAAGPRLFTIHVIDASPLNLPKAHTCFNRLDIPKYQSYEVMYDKLTQAVEETCGFAME